ncbi:structural maintenance of chromosomes protein 2-like [Anneissia japonica]|uniref:structural maintenance of chromosomes protein 2-like n=1 Tax=Anneissia japonica TaxID=1529436 RepID=UPI0014259734|nr:structural maintenance of chromosomes protein 2-like [Anneissia japonica]
MYIKEVILDGFKSYAQRTEVKGFDPLFNAITGLNGSGKSNILDSICFLLGITNLTQVRASNLQELVYKSGQAGVTKATVTILFDNTDKNQSPVGYEHFDEITVSRQVVIGGRNKYLINGSNANNSRVQDLFCSVQLNVNNPHFLIMQGRITKVLNMKPPEILSMIEEAAGTRMYENKKAAAQKTIEKKDAKLKEIESILKEEITPTLSTLRQERSAYLEYQKVMRELEHLTKLHIAFQFMSAEKINHESTQDLATVTEGVVKLKNRLKEIDDTLFALGKEIQTLQNQREEEASGTLKVLEAKLTEKQNADTRIQTSLQHKTEALNKEKNSLNDLFKSKKEDEILLKSKDKEIDENTAMYTKLQEICNTAAAAFTNAQKKLQAVSSGLASDDNGTDKTLEAEWRDCTNKLTNAGDNLKNAQMKLEEAQERLDKKMSEVKVTEKEYAKVKKTLDQIKKTKDELESEIKRLGFEDQIEDKLLREKQSLSVDIDKLQDTIVNLTERFPNLQFEYRDPEKNFDRRKVHGLVARLMKISDVNVATALEVSAGKKLYNVVVDSEVTGKKLLQKGELKKRFTIIPLNKISSRTLSPEIINGAKRLVGKDNVHFALSLIGYEKNVEAAMKFVFGSNFICNKMEHAKSVTFDPKIKTRTVTLAGDTFDPSGTLNGGSRNKSSAVLAMLSELQNAEDNLKEKLQKLAEVDNQLAKLKHSSEKFHQLKEQLDMKSHEFDSMQSLLQESTHTQQLNMIKKLQISVDEQQKTVEQSKLTQANMMEKMKTLEEKLKNPKAVQDQEIKAAEEQVDKAKKLAEQSNTNMKSKHQEMQMLKLEAETLRQDLCKYEKQIETTNETITGFEEQLKQVQEAARNSAETVKQSQQDLNRQREVLTECNQDINAKIGEQTQLSKEENDVKLQIKEMEHKAAKINKESKEAAQRVQNLLAKYEWIENEKQYFGQPNTGYDFTQNDPKEVGVRLHKLQEIKENLSKNVNLRAMNTLSKAEEKYNDLMKKQKIVVNDKKKIMATIKELDEKKNEALKKAWEQVNKDFGSIFSTLLPGTSAKLMPQEGHSILDGLEVKVAFGDVWKESLSELSGGQRSLVALSLILSLLLFKPAPLYILDEVDAALDLSHTQNIGQMLRTHFRHSQFIVVSLKDGMFNNANVLFKTKFIDGVSTVTRHAQVLSTSKGTSSNRGGSQANTVRHDSMRTANKNGSKRARVDLLSVHGH